MALERLADLDPDMGWAVEQFGPPPLRYRPPGFETLLRVIVAQQISLASAAAIWGRLCDACPNLTPEAFAALDDEALKVIGLSRPKQRYSRSLADLLLTGQLDLEKVPLMEDEEAIAALTQVKGLGRWSVEVYLLFSYGRPDVWPADDVGLMIGAQRLKNLPERPNAKAMRELAEAWRPWRSVAARVLWHCRVKLGEDGKAAAGKSQSEQRDTLP
ncbi:DNA-3-methyladenine glycosylase family protein [Rhodovibrionaceae bacterium A322]